MALRFPPIGPRTLEAVRAAQLRPIAEPLARTMHADDPENTPEYVPAPLGAMIEQQFSQLLRSIYRRGSIVQVPFLAQNTVPLLPLRIAEKRSYVFIQNQSGANQLILTLGHQPSLSTAPIDGIIIGANLGFYEPLMVPQDELWILGSGANTPGVLLYSLSEP